MARTMRFNDFWQMASKRASVGCVNGTDHPIRKGDVIGWSRKHRAACCASCWAKWTAENDAAEFDEAQYASQY